MAWGNHRMIRSVASGAFLFIMVFLNPASAVEEIPSIFTEPKCFGDFKMPGKPAPFTPPIIDFGPDVPLPPAVPLNPGSFGKPFLTSYTAPRYEVASAYALERKTGVPARLVLMFNGRASWADVEGNWALGRMASGLRQDPKVSYVDSVPLMPTNGINKDRQVRLTQCANGEFNGYYRTRGNRYKSMGIKNIIIRPGWEANIPSFPWGFDYRDDLARLYARCYANFVQSIRDVYPDSESGFMFDWNMQQGGLGAFKLESAYPGDAYVDIISLDFLRHLFW